MSTAKNDAPQATVERDYNAVKQTINEFMTGNISADDASAKLAAEATTMTKDHSADQVTARLNAAAKVPSDFPGLSIEIGPYGTFFNEASSTNLTKVGVFSDFSGHNIAFRTTSDVEGHSEVTNDVKTNPALLAAEKEIADKVLTVSNLYLTGKLDAKSTESQLAALVKSGDDPLKYGRAGWSSGHDNALQTEIRDEMDKYGLGMTQSYESGYTLWQPGGKNWNAINFTGDEVSTVNSTTERLKNDAVYAATGAAFGAFAFGPIGAAVGAVGMVAAAEIRRHEGSKLMQMGVETIADQGWNEKASNFSIF